MAFPIYFVEKLKNMIKTSAPYSEKYSEQLFYTDKDSCETVLTINDIQLRHGD